MNRLAFLLLTVAGVSSFVLPKSSPIRTSSCHVAAANLPTPEESAQALTDFMAKAHEEKIRAMKDVEKKFQSRIQELEEKLAAYESEESKNDAPSPIQSGSNTYHFPATNKALAEKVGAYQDFLSRYVVKSQIEKVTAVAAAEKKMKDKYEGIIAEMKSA